MTVSFYLIEIQPLHLHINLIGEYELDVWALRTLIRAGALKNAKNKALQLLRTCTLRNGNLEGVFPIMCGLKTLLFMYFIVCKCFTYCTLSLAEIDFETDYRP